MQGETKNLGQISSIWINSLAPENEKLIWYDTVERIHKVFDTSVSEWRALNPEVVTSASIDTIINIALSEGLSVGKFFFLTDYGTLAIALTSTKIWYVDSNNNYVVNDLNRNIQYYLNSNNLLIDGSTGVWDVESGVLKFEFIELNAYIDGDNDYIVMRRKSGNIWWWVKDKIKNIISLVTGNAISWNHGLYFNFSSSINSIKDVTGGIVSYDEYLDNKQRTDHAIANVAEIRNNILSDANHYTDVNVAPERIFAKEHFLPWNLYDNPPQQPNVTATLEDILQILVSWVKVLQKSTSIKIGSGFSFNGRTGDVNYSDNVRSAIEKLVYKIKEQGSSDGVKLAYDFDVSEYRKILPEANNSLTSAIGRICAYISDLLNITWESNFRDEDWSANVTLGQKIGEFDSTGKALYTATLEGALYLLSSWYDEHFKNSTADWVTTMVSYTCSYGDGDQRIGAQHNAYYKIDENNIIIRMNSGFTFPTKLGNYQQNIKDSSTDDITFMFKNLPPFVINALINKYGEGSPFNLGICVSCTERTVVDYPLFKASGVMYGIVVRTPDDELYLKLIPYFTDSREYIDRNISGTTVRGLVYQDCNRNGEFGSAWVDFNPSFVITNSECTAVISPFCVEIPLY